ncbi:MAG: hypothetical protein KAH07_02880 [Flavobacteriaceae bacterium]|nr:hypothetical protein [Flavobacteriaceae bacterium]
MNHIERQKKKIETIKMFESIGWIDIKESTPIDYKCVFVHANGEVTCGYLHKTTIFKKLYVDTGIAKIKNPICYLGYYCSVRFERIDFDEFIKVDINNIKTPYPMATV